MWAFYVFTCFRCTHSSRSVGARVSVCGAVAKFLIHLDLRSETEQVILRVTVAIQEDEIMFN